jgi:hypothetical protein
MQAVDLSKPVSVDVYSDRSSLDKSPWVRIGEFEATEEAIDACKRVIDDYLGSSINYFIEPNRLINCFLCHGSIPVISGADNLQTFDVYEYLAYRCKIISPYKSIN